MHDHGAADDAVASRLQADAGHLNFVDGNTVGVGGQVAEIPGVACTAVRAPVRGAGRIEVTAGARAVCGAAVALFVNVETVQAWC